MKDEQRAEAPKEVIADSVSLIIEGGDNMQFNRQELKVYTGQIVTLTLKHTGQLPKEAMGHNWVLLDKGKDVADFGIAASGAPKNGYIPQDKKDWTLAYTQVIGGGEETSITFTAPTTPGYFKYLCSFPGHWGVMQGDFVVQPR